MEGAAGVPVVSTPLEFTRQQRAGMAIGDSEDAFIEAIGAQLAHGRFTAGEARALVGEHTWATRLQRMLALIGRRPRG